MCLWIMREGPFLLWILCSFLLVTGAVTNAASFCREPTRPFATGPDSEIRIFVVDWDRWEPFYSKEMMDSMLPHIDQCQGNETFKAIFVHDEAEKVGVCFLVYNHKCLYVYICNVLALTCSSSQLRAHALLYNGPFYSGGDVLTFSKNQKTIMLHHEPRVSSVSLSLISLWASLIPELTPRQIFPHPDVDIEVSTRLEAELPLIYGCGTAKKVYRVFPGELRLI